MIVSGARRAMMAFVLSFVLAAGLLATPTPASAAASQCPAGYFCVWEHSPFTGHFAYFKTGSSDLRNAIGGFVFNNRITDVWNRAYPFCIYDGTSYRDPRKRINLGFQGYLGDWNDRISSLHFEDAGGGYPC